MPPAKKKPAPKKSASRTASKNVPDVPEFPAWEAVDLSDLAASQERVREFFLRLKDDPPQVLHLEGGTPDRREGMALYWAAMHNCERDGAAPCLECDSCRQVLARTHRDIFWLDGLGGSIKIDDVREVRAVLGEPPRGDGRRVVVLSEAQALTVEAANSLLKSLEEPRPGTSFVMTAPQRERLLPTLVSRGWVLTLGWPETGERPLSLAPRREGDEDPAAHAQAQAPSVVAAMQNFWQSGRGLFDLTGGKGAVDRHMAFAVILFVQRELVRALRGEAPATPGGGLAGWLSSRLGPEGMRRLGVLLAESQEALDYGVNPALITEQLAVRVHRWVN